MSLASTVAAEAVTRRALIDAGITLAVDDALPSRLVEIAQRYHLPPHVLVLWIQQARPEMVSDPVNFDRQCQRYMRSANQLDYDHSSEPGICQQCFRYPVQVVGGVAVCTSGRCPPRVAQ
jgi:hypothetical protein